jgi:hypothetical protein
LVTTIRGDVNTVQAPESVSVTVNPSQPWPLALTQIQATQQFPGTK